MATPTERLLDALAETVGNAQPGAIRGKADVLAAVQTVLLALTGDAEFGGEDGNTPVGGTEGERFALWLSNELDPDGSGRLFRDMPEA